MKRIVTLLTAIVLILGGMSLSADAKKKTSSSSRGTSTASVKFPMYEDGYPDISGHTYSTTTDGSKVTITFGRDGFATMKEIYKGKSGSIKCYWSYQGDGVISTFTNDASMSVEFYILDDGKSLLMDEDDIVFKLVK